jgi:hypothetical protein
MMLKNFFKRKIKNSYQIYLSKNTLFKPIEFPKLYFIFSLSTQLTRGDHVTLTIRGMISRNVISGI